MKSSNILILALALMFFGLGFFSMKTAMPEPKEMGIYNTLSQFFPYKIEKRLGGFSITFTDTKETIKPTNKEFYDKLKNIDQNWAKNHLQIKDNFVIVLDDNHKLLTSIKFKNNKEKLFILNYFNIKE